MNKEQLLQCAAEYDTPLYVYYADKMREQYNSLYNALDVPKVKLNYACKALTNINVLKIFNELGAGLDAVSIQEAKLGLLAGFAPKDIIYTPNCVSIDEIEKAIALGLRINIDNLEMLEHFGMKYGNELPICIRINPHVMAGGNQKISVGHIDSKFGISIHQLPHILRLVETLNIQVEGLHMHTGSDILDAEVFLFAADILLRQIKHFPDVEYVDFGSGFKVKYKEHDVHTDVKDFGEKISESFRKFCKELGRDLTLMFEPGKYLVSEAGYFLVKTNVVKRTTSTVFAGVDSGLNHLIRPMLYDSYHHISNITNPSGAPRVYTVVGYICETDTFGWNRKISEVRQGDILAFHNAGAYCFSMASNYNSRYRPAEVLIDGKDVRLIREREDFEDLTRGQVFR